MVPSELNNGDRVEIRFEFDSIECVRKATVLKEQSRPRDVILMFDSPITNDNDRAITHDEVWHSHLKNEATALGFKRDTHLEVSWWWDSSITLIKVISSASGREEPCLTCKRQNFLNETKCWWCGYHPFE